MGSEVESPDMEPEASQATPVDGGSKARERLEKFKALQARAVSGVCDILDLTDLIRPSQKKASERNMKDAAAETQRLATDPNLLSALNRKSQAASQKLLKDDTAAAGEDFERKRAWDWTVEESEKWDKRMAKKERHREEVAFQDYRQESRKVYKRQLRELKPDLERYDKEKAVAVQKAAAKGTLEIVETDDGDLVAVDKDGSFYSTVDSTDFVESKPDRAAVDRLVTDLHKAEETRLKKRKARGITDDDGDTTYINAANQQFNKRLARAYDKYTVEVRDSFERGTAI
ncbi:MAG: pre-mRNA-splicing factor syf2 [Thelocarpon superellum]|nr:MAG: pre-mRNA-splicing factor syf2 [Thelocarpon superellum]